MNNQPILFYSTRCTHSQQIIGTLKAMNKESLCRLYPIDGKGRHELPAFLKSVPTLYVPTTKDTFVGKEIYSYIAKPVSSRVEIPTESPGQKAQASPAAPGTPADYMAWSFEGTKGLTESYASWATPTDFASDNQLNFTFLGGTTNTPAPPEPKSVNTNTGAKNDDLSARLEEYQKIRDSEFKGVARQ